MGTDHPVYGKKKLLPLDLPLERPGVCPPGDHHQPRVRRRPHVLHTCIVDAPANRRSKSLARSGHEIARVRRHTHTHKMVTGAHRASSWRPCRSSSRSCGGAPPSAGSQATVPLLNKHVDDRQWLVWILELILYRGRDGYLIRAIHCHRVTEIMIPYYWWWPRQGDSIPRLSYYANVCITRRCHVLEEIGRIANVPAECPRGCWACVCRWSVWRFDLFHGS